MEEEFAKFNLYLDGESKTRDDIKQITKEIERLWRQMLATLQQIHGRINQADELAKKAESSLTELNSNFQSLVSLVPKGSEYKYRDHWKFSLSQIVFVLSFIQWLQTKELLSFEKAQELLGNLPSGINIELEDYLLGLCSLPNELSRLCVNSVTASNFELPLKISNFVSELYAGFRLLNLKNDMLRKRYDSIKYDMKKIEEVVYDISIRKLVPSPAQSV
eukprot:TRINITY_DN5849_c0_g1_i1.p1 TRINITY_DN5849_c0_g1~~TRINITY_DN5849_c0_g1_i1.p1  ORF type:complete len:219 (-),score=67.51 TRINITY_DN5849_c0_g1_i1:157-813(-)